MRELSEGAACGLLGLMTLGEEMEGIRNGARALREGVDFAGQEELVAAGGVEARRVMYPAAIRLVLLAMLDVETLCANRFGPGPGGCDEYPWWRVMLWLEVWRGLEG